VERFGERFRVHTDGGHRMEADGVIAGLGIRPNTELAEDVGLFFYSDLFDLGYEAVGELDPRLEIVEDWKEPYREGVVYFLDGGRVRGVLLWNVWGQVEAARALIAEPGPHTPQTFKGRLPG